MSIYNRMLLLAVVVVALLFDQSAAVAQETAKPYSYSAYRGGRSQVRYRFPRRNYPRNYRAYRPRVYYSAPAYRYPAYVYPRTPNMMYFGPTVRVTYGPWVYAL